MPQAIYEGSCPTTDSGETLILRSAHDLNMWRAALNTSADILSDPTQETALEAALETTRDVTQARPLIGLVPTMGALHKGHLSLIKIAKKQARFVLVSVFVNPTQFNDPKDFTGYPRAEAQDVSAAIAAGADAVFVPTADVIYPKGAQTRVHVGSLAHSLCGATRPGHFEGVCTVVMALFQLTRCDVAVFGEKDYQQLAIIRQMARDLHLSVDVVGGATLREDNGLAMSSRNLRLSTEQYALAPLIYQGLSATRVAWSSGERRVDVLRQVALERLPSQARLDYLEVCDPDSLKVQSGELQGALRERALIAIACFLGEVRLIDNVLLGGFELRE